MQTRSDIKHIFLVVEQLRKADWNVMLFHTVHLSLGTLHSSDLIHKVFFMIPQQPMSVANIEREYWAADSKSLSLLLNNKSNSC